MSTQFDPRKITVSSVAAGDLDGYYTFKIAGGLSPNTVIEHHAVIRSVLQWAVKHRYIRENVADFANKPERVRYHGPQPYRVEEVTQILQVTQRDSIVVPNLGHRHG